MAYYAISTREVVGRGATRRFNAEPAQQANYLIVPNGAPGFTPDQIVGGAKPEITWAGRLLAELPRDNLGRPAGDLVFLVHGFNVDEEDAWRGHDRFTRMLSAAGFPHVLVSYDWPSAGSLIEYLEDSQHAYATAPLLVQSGIALFAKFAGPDCRTRVHLAAHSMGAFVTREAFRQAEGHPPASQAAWGLNQLALIAADISAGSMSNELSRAMRAKAQRTTNYFSRYDGALATSNAKRFFSSPRAGRHGAGGDIADVVDVDCSDRWLSYSGDDPSAIEIADIGRSHTWYFEDAEFYADLAANLRGDLDRTRIPTRQQMPDGGLRLRP